MYVIKAAKTFLTLNDHLIVTAEAYEGKGCVGFGISITVKKSSFKKVSKKVIKMPMANTVRYYKVHLYVGSNKGSIWRLEREEFQSNLRKSKYFQNPLSLWVTRGNLHQHSTSSF
jgi:hypothetical protein